MKIADVLKRCPKIDRRQDGYTFNEILVAMSISAVGVMVYSLGSFGVIRGNSATNYYTVAVNLAQDKLEQLRSQNSLTNENQCPGGGDRSITASGGPGGILQRCWTVTDSPLGGNLKHITVTVSWQDHESRQVTFSTLKFSGG